MGPVDSSSSKTPRSPTTNGVQQPNLSLGAVGIEVQADDASFDVGGHAFSYNNNALAVTNNFFGQSSANNAQVRDFATRSLRAAAASHDLAYSNALAQRTPDTGQWFLELQEFARWKSGDLQLLECIGTPGAGKTVMSSIIIEHLRKSRSEAFILYLYHQTRAPHSQTLHTCALALLCQALEKGSELILPAELLRTFALQHGSADRLPTYELLRPDLIQALAGPDTYIVVDALDEYNIGDVVAQTEFIRELETLNVKILVTSRSHVPFKQRLRNFASCKISALPDDIRAFVNYSMEKSYLGDVLRRGDGTLDEVREAAVNKADGIFLSTKLLLTAMRGCHTISEVKSRLQESSSNLNGTYEQILIHIRATSPWILPLIYFMVIFVDRTIGARAMLQYLACDSWPGGSERIEDYIRGADDVLASCRGLVVLVDQQNEEDRGAQHVTPAIPDVGKGFQFCHSTALDYLQAHIVQDALSEARLALVHRFLSYAPKLLAGVPKEMGGARPDEDSYSAGRLYLRRWHPLSFHQDLWQHCAKQVEASVDCAAVDPYFSHPSLMWLAVCTSSWRISPDTLLANYVSMVLSSAGLLSLLERHLSQNPNMDINQPIGSEDGPNKILPVDAVEDRSHRDSQMSAPVAWADMNSTTPLHIAAWNGHVNVVLLLLKKGAFINSKARNGVTALIEATKSAKCHIAALLLEHGAAVDMADAKGRTALIIASVNGYIELATMMLSHNAAVNAKNKESKRAIVSGQHNTVITPPQIGHLVDLQEEGGWTAIKAAASNGHSDLVMALISHHASVDLADQIGWTPLMSASCNGHAQAAIGLLRNGASVDLQEKNGQTALMLAVRNGHSEIIMVLIDHNATVDRADHQGWTPLMSASYHGHVIATAVLLQNGASANLKNASGFSALTFAVRRGHYDAALLLLGPPASLRSAQKFGWTPLMQASLEGNLGTISELLRADASKSVNSKSDDGLTALLIAISFGRTNTLTTLLEHGADVSSSDSLGWKPMNYASSNGHIDLIAQLLAHGADRNSWDKDGDTTVAHAAAGGHHATVSYLLDRGASIDPVGEYGFTPLMVASARGHVAAVSTLLNRGAECTIRDNRGRTALMIAEENGHEATVLILRKWTDNVASKNCFLEHTNVHDDEDLPPPATNPLINTTSTDISPEHKSYLHRMAELHTTMLSRPILSRNNLLGAGSR